MYKFLLNKSLRFIIIHLLLHLLNYVTTYMYFHTCFNFFNENTLKSIVYSFLYSTSDYCSVLSATMITISGITKNMWNTVGMTLCMESLEIIKPFIRHNSNSKNISK